jgi:diaminohydroxyphosphoribosylaminopyrimidine deaminase / 5-amino-6-(5-phosphoribosylamino)uracil reductase
MNPKDIFMRRALMLAQRGEGMVSPNPMVGAVLVYQDRVIGEGYHMQYGGPHAEVNAINQVIEADRAFISLSTLYVTLEPCYHFGKTPPCVDLVLKEQIKHVIIAQFDPNPLTAGKSIERLRAAGVLVEVGVLESEAHWLNRAFIYTITTGRPYVILKWAQTNTGAIGLAGKRIKISEPISQRLVHKWRAATDAILVGKGTAQTDNPKLDLRYAVVQKPYLRIAWCIGGALAPNAYLLDDSQPTWLIGHDVDHSAWKQTKHMLLHGIEDLLDALMMVHCAILLVEGGRATLSRFLQAGAWNEIRVITSMKSFDQESEQIVHAPLLPATAIMRQSQTLGKDRIEWFVKDLSN